LPELISQGSDFLDRRSEILGALRLFRRRARRLSGRSCGLLGCRRNLPCSLHGLL
jgi:hypothetical protein